MTIFTNQPNDEKKDNEANKAKAAGYVMADSEPPSDDLPHAAFRPSIAWSSTVPTEWQVIERRRRFLGGLCVTLLIIWLLLAAVLGGLVAYRYFHRRPAYYGWCETTYFDDMYEAEHHSGQPTAMRSRRLEEKVEIDPEEQYEKIQVPEFGPNRPATFIHDFKLELTAIVDELGNKCFIKRLDRQAVSPPNSFMDLLKKMETGYYGKDARVVRETYKVGDRLTPDAVNSMGSWMIKQQCAGRATYELRKMNNNNDNARMPLLTQLTDALQVDNDVIKGKHNMDEELNELVHKVAVPLNARNRNRREAAQPADSGCQQFTSMSSEGVVNVMKIC